MSRSTRSRRAGAGIFVFSAALLAGCGGNGGAVVGEAVGEVVGEVEGAIEGAAEGAAPGGESGYVEPDYAGLPADLTPEEVCNLLDAGAVAEMIGAEVISVKEGTSQPDCTWMYKLPGGPATTLHVQVMAMSQTSDRLGTEALEWGLDWALQDTEIFRVDALSVPNGAYEFGASTVVFAIDPAGRLFTLSAHSDTPESGRIAVVEAVLGALTEQHS